MVVRRSGTLPGKDTRTAPWLQRKKTILSALGCTKKVQLLERSVIIVLMDNFVTTKLTQVPGYDHISRQWSKKARCMEGDQQRGSEHSWQRFGFQFCH